MPKKLVIFDLDNTLIITKPAAKKAYQQAIAHIAKQHGLDHSKDKLYHHWKKIVQSVLGENKPHLRRFKHSFKLLLEAHKIPSTYFSQALHTYETELLTNIKAQPGAKDLLHWLQEQGHKIAVATASERSEAIKKLKATDLYTFIDHLVTANEVGSMKPNTAYYTQTLKKAKIKAENVVAIGDSVEEDITPAEKLSIRNILITPKITHLNAIRTQIEKLLSK